ncbi:MAG: hypothetical protein FWF46_05445 [Oscillospiraceae bacterium]|nr:hypothetical protein [Oscillospiraceae bacterium]
MSDPTSKCILCNDTGFVDCKCKNTAPPLTSDVKSPSDLTQKCKLCHGIGKVPCKMCLNTEMKRKLAEYHRKPPSIPIGTFRPKGDKLD